MAPRRFYERIIILILISGRGRRRHFFVTPSVRTVRKLFERYPTSMNIFCYGTLFSTADMSQQTIQHHYKVTKSLKRLNFTNPIFSNSLLKWVRYYWWKYICLKVSDWSPTFATDEWPFYNTFLSYFFYIFSFCVVTFGSIQI